MGAIPNWMWQVGAMLKGADMAMDIGNNALSLYDNIGGIVDRSRFKDDLEKVQADPYAPVRAYASNQKVKRDKDGGITTHGTDYNAQLQAARETGLQQRALPVKQALDEYATSGYDSFTPEEVAAGYGVQIDPRNKYQSDALNQFRKNQGDYSAMQAGDMPRLYSSNPALADKFTEGQVRTQATIPKAQADVRKLNADMANEQELFAASQELAGNAELQKLDPVARANAIISKFRIKPEDAQKLFDATNTYRKTRNVEGGYGPGQDMQYTVDERTGQTIGTVGTPQDQQRKATRVSVNPIIQQESAYSRGTGDNLAKREGKIIDAGDAADELAGMVNSLEKALKKAPSGPFAGAYTAAGKYTGGMVGASKGEVAAFRQAETINKLLTLENIRKMGPGITNAEREFLMSAQAAPNLTRAEQQRVLDVYKKGIAYDKKKRDQLVQGTYNDDARTDPARSERNVRSTQSAPASSRYKVIEVQ